MTRFRQQQAKKIIFVFLVLTLISSLSTAAFVTGNAFAKKSSKSDGSGGGDGSDKGGSSGGGSSDKGGSSDNGGGGGGSSDTSGGGSSDNTGGGSSDTGSTSTPPSTTAEPSATEGSTSPPPPAAENQQTTCPDGTTVDPTTGACPTTTTTEQQNTAPETQGEQATCPGGTTVDPTTGDCPSTTSNPATTLAPNQKQCSEGQHFDPLILGCVPDNPPTSSTTTGGATTTGNTGTTTTPASTQGALDLQVPDKDGKCPQGYRLINTNVCAKDASTPSSSSSGGGGATTSTPPATQTGTTNGAAVHINSDGTLGTDANTDGSCPQGSDHTDNPKQCKVISMQANQDGTCPVHTSHFQGADAKQCFVDTALQTANTGVSTGTTPMPATTITTPVTCKTGEHIDTFSGKCTPNSVDILPGFKCPEDYHFSRGGDVCVSNIFAGHFGKCEIGWHRVDDVSKQECVKDNPPTPATSGGSGSTTTPVTCREDEVLDTSSGKCMASKTSDRTANNQCPDDYHLDIDGCYSNVFKLPVTDACAQGWHYADASKKQCARDTTPTTTQTGNNGGGASTTPTNTGTATPSTTPMKTGTETTEPPAELEVPPIPGTGSCPPGTHGGGTPTTVTCLAQKTPEGGFILPTHSTGDMGISSCRSGYVNVKFDLCVLNISCPQGTTKIGATQCIPNKLLPASSTTAFPAQKQDTTTASGGPTTTPTNTGNPNTTPTTTTTTATTPPTSTTSTTSSTTNVINRGSSSSAGGGTGGGSTAGAATPAQGSNPFLTYVNSVNKISIKYPSSWTKTDLVGNPRIPVMFNAPSVATTTPGAAAAKTNFVISITPSASSLDSFTQQQLNTLTQSKAIKYTITDTNAKVLTPPTGITAFREVSYDAVKNNNIPLKGAAIFFVNGNTGYSLLYLAKQTEYTQNLPMVQQMVNSFQVGAASGGSAPVQNVAAASSSPR